METRNGFHYCYPHVHSVAHRLRPVIGNYANIVKAIIALIPPMAHRLFSRGYRMTIVVLTSPTVHSRNINVNRTRHIGDTIAGGSPYARAQAGGEVGGGGKFGRCQVPYDSSVS